MRSKLVFLVLFLLGGAHCKSVEQVLFLEVRNKNGEIVKLEPDFPYAHVLISKKGKWIHSHPISGVAEIGNGDLNVFGEPKESFNVEFSDQAEEKLEKWIGRPYDSKFNWSDEGFYCSELVAKLLDISPEPMHFDPALWPPSFQSLEGLPGVSPGKIYDFLKTGGFLFKKSG